MVQSQNTMKPGERRQGQGNALNTHQDANKQTKQAASENISPSLEVTEKIL